MTLSRDAILAVNDTRLVPVEIPEWGGTVHIRPMTGRERDEYDMEMIGANKPENMRARMAVRVVCDENGQRLFRNEDAEALGKKSAAALDRIYSAMEAASKVRAEDVEQLKKD